jgi:hypothetical protein
MCLGNSKLTAPSVHHWIATFSPPVRLPRRLPAPHAPPFACHVSSHPPPDGTSSGQSRVPLVQARKQPGISPALVRTNDKKTHGNHSPTLMEQQGEIIFHNFVGNFGYPRFARNHLEPWLVISPNH